MNLQFKDINDCDGCIVNSGRLFSSCKQCEIRKCVIEKELERCAYCEDYACEKLTDFFIHDPDAEKQLEEIRNRMHN